MRVRDPDKEHAIREKALDMIVAHGFDGLSMQKLAKAAGVSPATIYIYFKDRDDLLIQLYVTESNKYFKYLMEDFDPEVDFATGMSMQWRKRAQYIIDHPDKAHFWENFAFTPLYQKTAELK